MQDSLLNQLHDIQLPDPVGWWPLAFTTWLMIFTLISTLIGVLWYYLDAKRRNAYRAEALQQLKTITLNNQLNACEQSAQINRLLKQVALTAFGRERTATLQSHAWIAFLKQTCDYINQPPNLNKAIELSYRKQTSYSIEETSELIQTMSEYASKWIKGHHQ